MELAFYTYYYLFLSWIYRLISFSGKKRTGILYLTAFYPGNAGYHWRAEKWAEELRKEGKNVTLMHALEEHEFRHFLEHDFQKFLILSLKRRFKQVHKSRRYETVIVQRELLIYNDYGNLFMEKLLLHIHPNAILDFDDDISAAKNQPRKITNLYGTLMKEHGDKFNASLKLYKHFIVASNFLKGRVLEQNMKISDKNVCVIPTCVDYDNYPAKDYSDCKGPIIFGWIGGDHNYHYLRNIIPTLNDISVLYNFKLLVIGGKEFKAEATFPIEFKKWTLETEISDLYCIDVGLMPLMDTKIAQGKGGFKLIQYMGLGIVSVASPITINKEIVENGIDSLLAMTENEWTQTLENVLKKEVNLSLIGSKAREKIERKYTFKSNKLKYIEFIKKVNSK